MHTAKHISGNLYRLSKPLRGFRLCSNGKAAHAPITHVLAFDDCVVESNADGDVCAWGAWPKSRGAGGPTEALKRIGYDVQP